MIKRIHRIGGTAQKARGVIDSVRGMVQNPLGGKSRGQALIYVTLAMTTLIGFAALATDTGLIWVNRRYLQNAADAAALAGAQELMEKDGPTKARAVACSYALSKNAVTGMTADCSGQGAAISEPCHSMPHIDMLVCQTYVPGDSIRVTTRKTINPIFGRAALPPFQPVNISAYAIAVVGSIHTVCVFPLFQTQNLLEMSGAWSSDGNGNLVQFNVPTIMKTTSDGSTNGNFLYLQANGSSSKDAIRDAIGSPGGCAQQSGDTAETAPGNAVGPLDQGMASRASYWNNASSPGYCPSTSPTFNADGTAVHAAGHPLAGQQLTPENCYRLVQIPMLAGLSTDYVGQSPGQVIGYLTFYISNWCGGNSDPPKGSPDAQHCPAPAGTTLPPLGWGELWGYYLKYEAVTDKPITPYDGLGTKVVVLAE